MIDYSLLVNPYLTRMLLWCVIPGIRPRSHTLYCRLSSVFELVLKVHIASLFHNVQHGCIDGVCHNDCCTASSFLKAAAPYDHVITANIWRVTR